MVARLAVYVNKPCYSSLCQDIEMNDKNHFKVNAPYRFTKQVRLIQPIIFTVCFLVIFLYLFFFSFCNSDRNCHSTRFVLSECEI